MKTGIAISLITPYDIERLEDIVRYSKADIKEFKNDNILKFIQEGAKKMIIDAHNHADWHKPDLQGFLKIWMSSILMLPGFFHGVSKT